MSGLPSDLVPLPTAPWDERPTELKLDIEETRTAIWLFRGNITRAADRLKVPPARLRAFVRASKRLMAEVDEAAEQLVDLAEDTVHNALTDGTDPGRQDAAAKLVLLQSKHGKARGWGSGASAANVNLKLGNSGNITIQWEDGSQISEPEPEEKVIEGVVNE